VTPVAGQVVFITGAARGLGAALARRLAGRGARLALCGIEAELGRSVADQCGPEAAWFDADVTDMAQLQAAAAAARERFGRIDVVVTNAGIGPVGAVETIAPDAFERTIEVNLLGTWRTVRATIDHVVESRGYVLTVASVAAVLRAPFSAHYSASKAGVEAFADCLRLELEGAGVAVGTAYFSFIDTDMARVALESEEGRLMDRLMRGGPLNRAYPIDRAIDALVDGIEQRRRRVVYPPWLWGMVASPRVHQRLSEAALRWRGVPRAVRDVVAAGAAERDGGS
jgi:NAD(P)-dependent dehydrogenase (short-subunit alcohol dehydrogenase family)